MDSIFGNDLVLTLPRYGDRTYITEPAQAMIVVRAARQLKDLERAAQVHIHTGLFRFPVQRGCAVDDGVGGMNETIVVVTIQTELGDGDVAGKNPDARLQMFVEAREIHVQLKPLPQSGGGFLRVFSADEHVERRAMIVQQVRCHMRANVAVDPVRNIAT